MRQILILTILTLTLLGCSKQEEDLQSLIGLDINSKHFQTYLNKLESEPKISKYDDSYYYVFNTKGIDFLFSNTDTITSVFLYSEGSDENRQFQGKTPYNIQFTDTRRDVEQKLGPPDKNGGGGVISFYSSWDMEGISITYKTKDQEDMMNKIHHISLTKKSDK